MRGIKMYNEGRKAHRKEMVVYHENNCFSRWT